MTINPVTISVKEPKPKSKNVRAAMLTWFPESLKGHIFVDDEKSIKELSVKVEGIIKNAYEGSSSWMSFIVGQLELTREGKLHIQFYVETKHPKTFKRFVENFKGAHVEARKGSAQDCIIYCTKLKSRVAGPWYFGAPKKIENSDIEDYRIEAVEMIKKDRTNALYNIGHKNPSYYKKDRQWLELMVNKQPMTIEYIKEFKPRVWQSYLLEVVEKRPVDQRKIYWFVDEKGGCGKTYMSKWLVQEKKAFYTRGTSKGADVKYLYKNEQLVIFDYARAFKQELGDFKKDGDFAYGLMEEFKDGMINSDKYESILKGCKDCIVIAFSNERPDKGKLSKDRWHITIVDPDADKIIYQDGSKNGKVIGLEDVNQEPIQAKTVEPIYIYETVKPITTVDKYIEKLTGR